ncbi:MAG TPA: aminopeptidase P family protein, partial [Alphaproteobacteria bacterium]
MAAGTVKYGGDAALDRLLARAGKGAGVRLATARAVRGLIRGVLAAPEGRDPEAWMALVADRPPGALRAQLAALKARMAGAPARPGLA